ncbi:HPr family phosphocarrier protein [Bradyrhizobium sp. U87765 SZCCT0131]|uniref:HPr family phosphocarrier protein n=1 Tax=unclassified Bradyrhizobium TaxID=2631580 RepID=UPI001BAD5D54|nr:MULTISPECIES: HPr family phosphocarrier protein [unclassified Bradyrhizobium]MBR1217356.1 HPr family phosphocarrier protein [Bradyrhizobium sp. U87765 SZCCT0131]MBR1265047.1 HPr family phosphocarrier protein [Bradyrhizobium sp. U87765 SZCCT0134]MBR1305029.1 HPr family phosphocarrier protein [Bradyrhizobium sp. U87765 SZCCT0110]MBR1320815.1 HPr family phosphocarrier protein [Bradyrhizobium sp. U87765 SZCCT0109]MBR1349235.1 HPr family phosphocarrier protein [Bradyrhizobium sp. U87765 SZCCT004
MADNDGKPDTVSALPGVYVREVPITNKRGLHARASAKFVQMVEQFDADITVTRNGETVGGTSIMGLMMLAAGIGTSILITAKGREAQSALDAIAGLVTNKFGEDE